jgi:hypothetical protein
LSYPTKFAPLSPIVSSILMARFGVDENVAFYTHILFYATTVLVTFWWVREQSSRLAAITASLLVASLPDIVLYTRTYQYGLPTAFFFLLANFAYYKSARFSSRLWSLWAGAALGLMLLSRTMSIAFLPAFGLVWLLDSRKVLRQNIAGFGVSVAVFLLIAVPWYTLNFKEIFGYLFSFGYGASSTEYGLGTVSILSVNYLILRIQDFVGPLYPFHLLFVFVLFWVCVFQQAKTYVRKQDLKSTCLSVPAFIVVLCIGILFSSKNRGSGFEVPLLPVMVFCAVCTIPIVIKKDNLTFAIFSIMSLGSLLTGYFQSTITACNNAPDFIVRPLVDSTRNKICDGYIGQYIREAVGKPGKDQSYWENISYPDQKTWREVSVEIADQLQAINKDKGPIVYVTRNRLVNVNTVMLAFVRKFGYILPASQIEPATLNASYADYRGWFDNTAQTNTCAVLMMSNTSGDFFPRPDVNLLRKVVSDRGFVLTARVPTPEAGMFAEIWSSKIGCGNEGK